MQLFQPADALVAVDHQDDELITTQARYGVDFPAAALQAFGDLHQKLVAGIVAEAVVDHLEVIQIYKSQGELGVVAAGKGNGLADTVVEQVTIWQTTRLAYLEAMEAQKKIFKIWMLPLII